MLLRHFVKYTYILHRHYTCYRYYIFGEKDELPNVNAYFLKLFKYFSIEYNAIFKNSTNDKMSVPVLPAKCTDMDTTQFFQTKTSCHQK